MPEALPKSGAVLVLHKAFPSVPQACSTLLAVLLLA